MVDLQILSVKHTGTTFLRVLFGHALKREIKFEHFQYHHFDNKLSDVVISPIRHPYLVYKTWYNREHFGPDFFQEWKYLNRAYLENKTFVLPIDTDERKIRLEDFGNNIGVKLTTDWTPERQLSTLEPPKMDISKVYELEVVKRFYGDLV